MNWVDYTVLAIIAVSVVVSLIRGFLREVLSLAVWVAAFWVAFTFSDLASAWLEPHVVLPSARMALAFGGLFLITLTVGGLLNYLFGKLIDTTGLSTTDRFIGMIFGALRGLAVVVALILVAGLTPMPRDPWWQESRLMPRLESAANWVKGYLPDGIAQYISFDPEKPDPELPLELPDSLLPNLPKGEPVEETATQGEQSDPESD